MQPLIDGDVTVFPTGRVWSHISNKFLTPYATNKGHLYVTIRGKKYYVHRLVASTYLSNPNKYPIVGHIDNDPTNNHYSNLEWCTQSHNMKHSYDTGRQPKRIVYKHPNCKLTDEQAIEIYNSTGPQRVVAELYGVSARTVLDIRKGRKYSRVTRKEAVH